MYVSNQPYCNESSYVYQMTSQHVSMTESDALNSCHVIFVLSEAFGSLQKMLWSMHVYATLWFSVNITQSIWIDLGIINLDQSICG